jgi:MATE family multidrug resistance protein
MGCESLRARCFVRRPDNKPVKERDSHRHGVTEPVTPEPVETRDGLVAEMAATMRLAVPLAGAQIAIVAMSATDAAFLGRLGPTALAGGGLAASIHATVQLLAAGALTVIAPLAAEARARADDTRLAAIAWHGLVTATVLGTGGAFAVQHVGAPLRWLGVEADIVRVVEPFLRSVAWSTPFALLSAVFRHIFTAAGRPRIVTITAFGAAGLNAFLDYVLIHGAFGFPAMGAAGVGAATTFVNITTCVVLGFAIGRVVPPRAVIRSRLERRLVRELAILGVPAAVMIGAEVAAFQLAGVAIGRYGATSLAAHQIALTVATMTFVVPLGIGQAAAVRVAHARACGGELATRRAGLVSIVLATSFMAVAAVALWILPEALTRAFVRADTTAMHRLFQTARGVLAVAGIFQIFDGIQVVAAGALRGLRDTRVPAAIAVANYGVVAPVTAWLAAVELDLGVAGVWIGLATALAIVGVTLSVRFTRLTSRLAADVS